MKYSVSGSSTIRTKPLLRLGDYHSVLGSTIEWFLKTWHTVYSDPAYFKLSSPESDDSLELDDLSFVGGGRDAGILPVAGSLSSSTHLLPDCHCLHFFPLHLWQCLICVLQYTFHNLAPLLSWLSFSTLCNRSLRKILFACPV